jgi:hypothetical protein
VKRRDIRRLRQGIQLRRRESRLQPMAQHRPGGSRKRPLATAPPGRLLVDGSSAPLSTDQLLGLLTGCRFCTGSPLRVTATDDFPWAIDCDRCRARWLLYQHGSIHEVRDPATDVFLAALQSSSDGLVFPAIFVDRRTTFDEQALRVRLAVRVEQSGGRVRVVGADG